MRTHTVLVINPGSTSDEVAVYRGQSPLFHEVIRHSAQALMPFDGLPVTSQMTLRRQIVDHAIQAHHIALDSLDAVIGRGGFLRPVHSGVYRVGPDMLEDLRLGRSGDHASNLGGLLAFAIAAPLDKPAFVADPPVVDELIDPARYSGMPTNPRVSIFHALNQRRVARMAAAQLDKPYEACNFIVVHAGGGISVGAHRSGRVIDVNNALDGDGPFTPQRSGGVPAGALVRMCRTEDEALVARRIKGRGGLSAYTGTADVELLCRFIDAQPLREGEREQLHPDLTPAHAALALEAMVYQIAKEVGGLAAVLHGDVDAILLTGGLAYNQSRFVEPIAQHVRWIAPLIVFPGGDEMGALNEMACAALDGACPVEEYTR